MTTTVKLSLIVATRGDRTAALRRLLRSIETGSALPLEVIIVDQGPPGRRGASGAVTMTTFDVRMLAQPGRTGASSGRNAGLAAARGEYVAFPDDDCWYPQTALAAAARHLAEHPQHATLCGRVAWVGDGDTAATPRFLRRAGLVTPRDAGRAGSEITMFFRTSILRRHGGFNEYLGAGAQSPWQAGESIELLLRLIEQGEDVWFDPALEVHHQRPVYEPDKMAGYARGVGYAFRLGGAPRATVIGLVGRPVIGAGLAVATLRPRLARQRWASARQRLEGWRAGGTSERSG